MKVLHYYAKINENGICYGFETLAKKFKDEELPSNLVYLPDYNESLLYKKWLGDKGWSMESFEPETDFELLERIETLETDIENEQQEKEILSNQVVELNQNINLLEGTIAELMAALGTMGGAE